MSETTTVCGCEHHDDGSRTWVRECPEHGEDAIMAKLLAPGARIRDARHPELTGRVQCHEWRDPEHISALPYNIDWDDNSRAADVLGMFFIYAGIDDVEPLEPTDV